MSGRAIRSWAMGLTTLAVAAAVGGEALAQDFFSSFFRGFNGRSASEQGAPLPYSNPYESGGGYNHNQSFFPDFGQGQIEVRRPRVAHSSGGGSGGQAYCVRTCDGRYFPISSSGDQSKAETCKSFCPASETQVVYGSSIDNASTSKGKSYSSLPNAFKYRTELVAGCTCNGKDQMGLAPVKLEDDPTLRKGDIVAGADGLMVSRQSGAEKDRRGASLQFSPASASIRAKYATVPVVAAD